MHLCPLINTYSGLFCTVIPFEKCNWSSIVRSCVLGSHFWLQSVIFRLYLGRQPLTVLVFLFPKNIPLQIEFIICWKLSLPSHSSLHNFLKKWTTCGHVIHSFRYRTKWIFFLLLAWHSISKLWPFQKWGLMKHKHALKHARLVKLTE